MSGNILERTRSAIKLAFCLFLGKPIKFSGEINDSLKVKIKIELE